MHHGEEYWLVEPKVHKRPAIHLRQNGTKTGIYQWHQICQLVSRALQN